MKLEHNDVRDWKSSFRHNCRQNLHKKSTFSLQTQHILTSSRKNQKTKEKQLLLKSRLTCLQRGSNLDSSPRSFNRCALQHPQKNHILCEGHQLQQLWTKIKFSVSISYKYNILCCKINPLLDNYILIWFKHE